MDAVRMSAIDALQELLRRGYRISPTTRSEIYDHKGDGTHAVTYAHRLRVAGGPGPLEEELRQAVRAHRPQLLAAACVLDPPIAWLGVLIERYGTGYELEIRREGWKGLYRVGLAMVAANVAAFIGMHPAHGGPELEAIIKEALKEVKT